MTRLVVNKTLFVIGIFALIVSCSPKKNYTTEINRIDSLQVALNSHLRDVLAAPSLNTERVAEYLKFIQTSHVGELDESRAKMLEQYSLTDKSVLLYNTVRDSLLERANMLNASITNLKQALIENATHDANGIPIDENYVSNAIQSESEKVTLLTDRLQIWIGGYKNIQSDCTRLEPQVKQMIDSLTLLKR